MAQDSNPNRAAGIAPAAPKTPAERAQQIQEMQRQAESLPTPAAPTAAPPAPVREAAVASLVQKAKDVIEVAKPEAPTTIAGTTNQGADQLGYGATQVDERALFGLGNNNAPEVIGNPWKIIPFGDPPERQLAPILDLKKPVADYVFDVPPNSVKIKAGHLFEVGVKPKQGSGSTEAPKRQAVIVDKEGNIKGAEFKNAGALEKGLGSFPGFARNLFASVFGEGLQKDDPERMKVLKVVTGKKSTFEAVLEYRSPLDGKKREKTVPLNNFGMRVAESNDPRRHDVITRMYRLDSFEAAPARQS